MHEYIDRETFEDHEVPLNFFNGALHGYTNGIPLVNSTWYCIGSKSEAGQSGHLSPGMSSSFNDDPRLGRYQRNLVVARRQHTPVTGGEAFSLDQGHLARYLLAMAKYDFI